MNTFLHKYGPYLVGIFLIAILMHGAYGPTPELKVEAALQNLFIDSPRMKTLYDEATKNSRISIVEKDLQNSEEATTQVFEDGHVVITIDIPKVVQSHDRLEPVIAHELFHVRDFEKMGYAEFVQIASEDKDLPWNQRRLERMAILQENALRAELLGTGHYGGMAKTREETIARNH